MTKPRIVVVDDDKDILDLISLYLDSSFEITTVQRSREALTVIEATKPSAVILDRMMGPPTGDEICATLRKRGDELGILMLTAKSSTEDVVHGLDVGADDYLRKPFSGEELGARVRALLRRFSLGTGDALRFDEKRNLVYLDGEPLSLTPTEYRLLRNLSRRPGRVYSRNELLDAGVCAHEFPSDRTIDAHIRSLRSKLGSKRTWIQTVRGVGYVFEGTNE